MKRSRDEIARSLAGLPRAAAGLHGRLGIETEVRRMAVLAGPYRNVPSWDHQNRVSSDNHLYRASVTLPKVLP